MSHTLLIERKLLSSLIAFKFHSTQQDDFVQCAIDFCLDDRSKEAWESYRVQGWRENLLYAFRATILKDKTAIDFFQKYILNKVTGYEIKGGLLFLYSSLNTSDFRDFLEKYHKALDTKSAYFNRPFPVEKWLETFIDLIYENQPKYPNKMKTITNLMKIIDGVRYRLEADI